MNAAQVSANFFAEMPSTDDFAIDGLAKEKWAKIVELSRRAWSIVPEG
jgi:hypothetical protein